MSIHYKFSAIGHEAQQSFLKRLLQKGDVPHAFLMYGQRDIGKAEVARLFASAVLCSNATTRPCGNCLSCSSFTLGNHPDAHVLLRNTGGDSLGVEQVRDFEHTLGLRPILTANKVGMIFGAEDLTVIAANSLLKLIEEPPASVVLILVANTITSLPPTLLSRCLLLKFYPQSRSMIAQNINSDTDLQPEALATVLNVSMGRGKKADELLQDGLRSYSTVMKSAIRFLENNSLDRLLSLSALIREMKEETERAADVARQTEDLLQYMELLIRDMIMAKIDVSLMVDALHQKSIQKLSKKFTLSDLKRHLEALDEMRQNLSRHLNVQLVWENFLIKI